MIAYEALGKALFRFILTAFILGILITKLCG